MAVAWSRISSKVITDPPCARPCAGDHGAWETLSEDRCTANSRQRKVGSYGGRDAEEPYSPPDGAVASTPLIKEPHGAKECPMPPATRCATNPAKTRRRRYRKAHERLARDRRQAQHAAEALQQALDDLGLPEDLVAEIEGRLRRQQKLLGKIVGVMCPPLFGCRTNTGLCRVRGWDKNLPSRVLGALPKRSWIKRLRRLGLEVLLPLWRHAASKSEATRSRWQWTWVGDDSVFKKYGEQLGLVGTWWSGQEHRV